MKRQCPECEEILANHITDKGLVFRLYEEPLQLNDKKTNKPIFKMGKGCEQTFLQRRYTHGQQAFEKMSNIICH